MNLGSTELLIVLVLVVVVFGAGWLPKAARNLGRAKVEIDKGQRQFAEAKKVAIEATGLEKAEESIRKANQALNKSPKALLKGAAASAMTPAARTGAADDVIETTEATESDNDAAGDAPATAPGSTDDQPAEPRARSETINIDLSGDEQTD